LAQVDSGDTVVSTQSIWSKTRFRPNHDIYEKTRFRSSTPTLNTKHTHTTSLIHFELFAFQGGSPAIFIADIDLQHIGTHCSGNASSFCALYFRNIIIFALKDVDTKNKGLRFADGEPK
jgi:hypothetical protein